MGVLPAIAILAYYSNSIWRDYSLLSPCICIFCVHISAAILFFRRLVSALYTGIADPSQIIVFISYLRIVMSGGKKMAVCFKYIRFSPSIRGLWKPRLELGHVSGISGVLDMTLLDNLLRAQDMASSTSIPNRLGRKFFGVELNV